MKLTSHLFILISISVLSLQQLQAQHIKIDKKILSFLADEKQINVIFTFENTIIDNDVPETEFLVKMNKKITRLANQEEASNWLKEYYKHKNEIWGDAFLNMLNKKVSNFKNSPYFTSDINANYSMLVNTKWMYYGYDAGITDMPAKLTLILTFYKTNEPNNILYTTKISRAEGTYNKTKGDNEGVGPSLNRMRKAYIKAAYKLAQSFKRVVD